MVGNFDEFYDICRRMTDKTLDKEEKFTRGQFKDLSARGKIGTTSGTIKKYGSN